MSDQTDSTLLLDNQLCFALYAASRLVIQRYNPMLTEMDLTYTQYITLLVLWQKHPLPIKDLGQALLLDTGTLTPMLKKLEAKNYITRTRSKQDERVVMIDLTPAGAAIKKVAQEFLPTLYCTPGVDPTELIDLREKLKALIGSLSECSDQNQD